jgi:hypothetical protein
MIGDKIPSVLTPKPPDSSISTERALKQIKQLLEEHQSLTENEHTEDMLNASIDDVEVMLGCIER